MCINSCIQDIKRENVTGKIHKSVFFEKGFACKNYFSDLSNDISCFHYKVIKFVALFYLLHYSKDIMPR